MIGNLSIEEKLKEFAELGIDHGFSLRIWTPKAEALKKEGIRLLNPEPTGRQGENRYEVDFSHPVPGTMSEKLYNIALRARKNKTD